MTMVWPRRVWVPILVLSCLVFGWRSTTIPLTNWDEGIYANVNLELFRSHDWTKLTYFGADFLEKPPLQFWATSFLIGVFGPTELAIRLPSLLAGVGTVMLVAWWVWQITGRRWPTYVAAGGAMFGKFAMIHLFRTGDVDGLLVLFVTAALYAYWSATQSADRRDIRRWMLCWAAATAGAVMTKSLAGALPLIIVGSDILLSRGWRKIGWMTPVWSAGLFLLIAAPWHIIETIRFGSAFWDSYLGTHVLERAADSLFTSTAWYWYGGIILERFAPFSFFLPWAFGWAVYRAIVHRDGLMRLLVLWLVITAVIFTLIQTRREWYIAPLYPAAVLVLVLAGDAWLRSRRQVRLMWIGLGLTLVVALGHTLHDTTIRLALNHVPLVRALTTPWWRTMIGQGSFGILFVGTIVLLSFIRIRHFNRAHRFAMLSVLAMFITAASWTVLHIWSQPRSLPLKDVATAMIATDQQNIALIGTRLKKNPAGYFYLLRSDIHTTEFVAGSPSPTPIVLTTNESMNALLASYGRVIFVAERYLLLDLR